LAAKLKKPYRALAMGSDEGFELAEKTIAAAAKAGSWVLLKNIHLAPAWLVQLEKRIHTLNPHANFRLFMTSEIHPKLPGNLLRMAQVFVFEPPPGVKANLQHTFSAIPAARMEKAPVEPHDSTSCWPVSMLWSRNGCVMLPLGGPRCSSSMRRTRG